MDLAILACTPIAAHQRATAAAAVPIPPALTKPPPQPLIAPVTPSASAEAVVMVNARADPPAGIEFDDIPFTGDADILVDDIIRPDAN